MGRAIAKPIKYLTTKPGRVGKRLYRLPTLNWHNRWASKKTLAHPTRLDIGATDFEPRMLGCVFLQPNISRTRIHKHPHFVGLAERQPNLRGCAESINITTTSMLKKTHFPILVEQDIDGFFIVSCPLFQGCRSYGKNIDEALKNIQEVIELCLEEQQDNEPANVFIGIRDIELAV